MTHTYAILDVSRQAYDEIRAKLAEAGYQHAFHEDEGREVIDMHGIALRADGKPLDFIRGVKASLRTTRKDSER